MISVTVDNQKTLKVIENMDVVDQRVLLGVIDGVNKGAQQVAGDAQTRFAPIDKGDLRGSIGVNIKVNVDPTKAAVIGEIYAAVPYAAAQHEGVDFVHPMPPNNPEAGAHYLSGPLKSREGDILQLVKDSVANVLRQQME